MSIFLTVLQETYLETQSDVFGGAIIVKWGKEEPLKSLGYF